MIRTSATRTSHGRRAAVSALAVGALLLAGAAWLPAQALDGGGEAQSAYTPPPCIGVFSDVPCGGPTGNVFASWIEQLATDHITLGCEAGKYCPGAPVLRQEMAVFLERVMRGTDNWPPHTVLAFHHPAAETNSDVNSGTELLALLAAIPTTGSEAPSASNPWLIKVGPGTFDLGSGQVSVPSYTALEGAGRGQTILTGLGAGSLATSAKVTLDESSALRELTVLNTGGGATYSVGVRAPSAGVVIQDVAIQASGATAVTYGLYSQAGLRLRNAEVSATGVNPTALQFSTGVLRIEDAQLLASASAATLAVGLHVLSSSPVELSRVEAKVSVSGGAFGVGAMVEDSAFTADSCAFFGGTSGTSAGYAVSLSFGSDVRISDSRLFAWTYGGGTGNTIGLNNYETSAQLDRVDVDAMTYSVLNSSAAVDRTLYIRGSTLFGSFYNGANYSTRIAATELSSVAFTDYGDALVCAGVWNGAYTFIPSGCP